MASNAHAATQCTDVTIPVSLNAKLSKDQKIYGRLCRPAEGAVSTLQILVHGSSYDHRYWDLPRVGTRYSYVNAMNMAGRATLAIDQLGVGRSSHPPSLLVSAAANANALHDVVTAARAGTFGYKASKVVLVGHSAGALLSWQVADAFHDVDGIVSSGASHSSGLLYLTRVLGLTRPALLDPVTARRIPPLDLGYVSIPGARSRLFYYSANAAASVVDQDEAQRSEFTLGGTPTVTAFNPGTLSITAPVLIVNGAYDMPFCKQGGGGSKTDCGSAATLRAAEAPYFPAATSLETAIVPNAGHSINLHNNADYFFNRTLSWLARYFPL